MLKIVINGYPEAGKDTFVDLCIGELTKYGIHSKKCSSVGGVKTAARLLGWDGVKDAKGRSFLSRLKDMSTNEYDGPMSYMIETMKETTATVMFFFIREPEEIEKFEMSQENVITVLLTRELVKECNNPADSRVGLYEYDYQVFNNGTIQELRVKAIEFLSMIGLDRMR